MLDLEETFLKSYYKYVLKNKGKYSQRISEGTGREYQQRNANHKTRVERKL